MKASWLTCAAFAMILVSCPSDSGDQVERSPWNVVWLSIDTLRADHLGCYGYERATSPVIDDLASRSFVFKDMVAPTPWTLPSHAAMLSGRHPFEIGVRHLEDRIPESVRLVSEVFRDAGYATGGFVDSRPRGFVGARRGFGRGFDTYRHAASEDPGRRLYDMRRTVDDAVEWLDGRERGAPFFLFLHTKSVHTARDSAAPLPVPYYKPSPYLERFLPGDGPRFDWSLDADTKGVRMLRQLNEEIAEGRYDPDAFPAEKLDELVALYDAGIYYTDEHFGRLLRELDARGLSASTVLVVTSDHGEGFLEHGLFLHKQVHRGLVQVPLLIHLPGMNERRDVTTPGELMDLAPTLLAWLGLPPLEGATGRAASKTGASSGPVAPRFSSFDLEEGHFYEAFGVHHGRWKLVRDKFRRSPDHRMDLYDTAVDPGERRPVTGEDERKTALLAKLQAFFARPPTVATTPEKSSPADIEELRSLGYLQ